ncbi:SDR family NAD(P)-dependent oxidoreductase [Streptomyces sp. NPDC004629]|uniref:SDR family NAD(P)-dependent oxidoreductase n=1 Tax=Streptomyces sp. NPDC004629 TaxID=3364705 RepID=UPI0036A55B71
MTDRLRGKTILVTGAASGIGATVATAFAAEGAHVAFTDLDLEGARTVAKSAPRPAGQEHTALLLDVTDEGSVSRAFDTLSAAGTPADVVVANAGVQLFGQDAQVADLDLAVFRQTVEVNLVGTFLTLKHAVRSMLTSGGGSIIVTGSPTALNGEGADFTAYSSAKSGGHGLTRAVAAAYADQGIRANTVVPGYTETPLVTTISDDSAARRAIVGRTPLRRAGTPEDVAGIMIYLASDESSYATGAEFRVDGGMTTL